MQTNFRLRLKTVGVKDPPALLAQLGCSWPFFVWHIESLFTPEMTWQNYGSARVLHHLRPVSDFDFRRQRGVVYLVNHWRNLRPLSPTENALRAERVHAVDVVQLQWNIEKAKRLSMTGRIRRQRTSRV
jgi:hypothetical protein